MNKRLLSLLMVLSLFLISGLARAAEPTPGSSCSTAQQYIRVGGPETGGAGYLMVCQGGTWKPVMGSDASGNLTKLGNQTCNTGEFLKFDGTKWVCAALKGMNVALACTVALDGTIKYNPGNNPPWQYCDGGTTSWLPFRLPQCQNDGTGECTLAVLRSSNDPQFTVSNIRCGINVLGITGVYGNGASSAFNFSNVTNAALSTLITAGTLAISGIPAGCPGVVEVSGQGAPQISVNGGVWSTSASIANGNTLAVRLTSSASPSTTYTATIAIGSTTDTWSVTTVGPDTTPNAFTFTDQTGVNPSTLTYSNTITITGINTTTPVSVSGSGAQISINGGGWVTSGTITNGQTLRVRMTSSSSFNTTVATTVNVGGVTDSWSVKTPTCGGTMVDGYCWYPGTVNKGCDEACASHGGCNMAGLLHAGSDGTNADCKAVLDALGIWSGAVGTGAGADLGCAFNSYVTGRWRYTGTTTCEGSYIYNKRACACNY